MSDVLVLRRDVVSAVLDHASAAVPNEACGLISGRDGVGDRYHPARNALASPYRFHVDPADLVRIMEACEVAGEELVAIAHSHPATEPMPSATDLRDARYAVPQLIAGTEVAGSLPTRLRAWWLDGAHARELALRVIERDQQSAERLSTIRPATGSMTTSTAHEASSFPER